MSESDEIVPKKEAPEGPARPRTLWVSDSLWNEIAAVAAAENYSTSKFVGLLIRAGFAAFKKQRAQKEKP